MQDTGSLKERIILYVRDKFKQYGYKAVKTDEIVADLGISKRTLYKEIGSKPKMLEEVLKYQLNKIYEKIKEKTVLIKNGTIEEIKKQNEGLIDTIVETNRFFDESMISDIKKNIPEIFSEFDKQFHQHVIEAVDELLEVSKDRGLVRKDLNNKLFFQVVHSTMSYLTDNKIHRKLNITVEDMLRSSMQIFITGIGTDSGKEEFLKNNVIGI